MPKCGFPVGESIHQFVPSPLLQGAQESGLTVVPLGEGMAVNSAGCWVLDLLVVFLDQALKAAQ
eukprot:3734629-Prorocentrum_lima.AAC.1